MAKAGEASDIMERTGRALCGLLDKLELDGVFVTSIKVKYPTVDPMVIITGKVDGVHSVVFMGGPSIAAACDKLRKDAFEGMLEWREDKYRNE